MSYITHPLYLSTFKINKNENILSIPSDINAFNEDGIKIYQYTKEEKGVNITNLDFDVAEINFNEKKFLELVYNITSWEDLYLYLKKDLDNNIINTVERLMSYSWLVFTDYKFNMEFIIDIYKIYLKKKIDEKKFKKIIESLKNESNKHKKILELLK